MISIKKTAIYCAICSAVDVAIRSVLPAPATVPPKPARLARSRVDLSRVDPSRPLPDPASSSANDRDKDADELGSKRRLLSPAEVSDLGIRRPRGEDLVKFLQQQPWYTGQVVASVSRPARSAVYGDLTGEGARLPPALWTALRSRGIARLYLHQARAIDAALSGKHVVVSTATASGKSLAYVPAPGHINTEFIPPFSA